MDPLQKEYKEYHSGGNTLLQLMATIIFFLFYSSAGATNYYFSSVSGDDLRSSVVAQNPSTPWKTITKLNSIFNSLLPGDSVLFKRGETFYGSITINKSGNSTNQIIIGAFGSSTEQPIITSLVNLGSATLTGTTNVWKFPANSSLGSTVNIVLQNGVAKPLGRYPNLSASNKGYLKFEASTSTSITDNELPLTTSWTGAEICVRVQHYETNVRVVSAQTNTKLSVSSAFSRTALPGMGYFFQDHINTLDQPGEWYYNPNTKEVFVYSTSIPTGTWQATSLASLVTSTTFSWVTIRDLYLKGANDKAIDLGVCISCGSGGGNIATRNNTISFQMVGINTTQHSTPKILSNTITYSFGQAINITNGPNADVGYNNIQYAGHIPGMGQSYNGYGIFAKTNSNGIIYNNTFRNLGGTGISFDGDDFVTENNIIDSFCLTMNDLAGIYHRPSGTSKRTGQIVRFNIISNSGDARAGSLYSTLYQTEGIYMDADSKGIQLLDNSIYNVGDAAILINFRDSNITVKRNTAYDFKYGILVSSKSGGRTRNLVIKDNVFFAKNTSQVPAEYKSDSNEVHLFGQIDSNYYCRPLFEPNNIRNSGSSSSGGTIHMIRGINGYYSVVGGITLDFPSYEVNGKKSPKGYDTLRAEFNTSYRDSVINLNYGNRDYTWLTARGTRVKGTYTIPAFSSVVMIRDTIVPVVTVPNIKPVVTLTSPANGASYTALASVSLAATATDADGTISIVRFYSGSTLIGSDNSSPYTFSWTSIPAGGYSLTAVAVDNSGDSTISAAISISVSSPPPPNTLPTVSITTPTNGATYTAPGTVQIVATAADADGTITQVQFYNGALLINTDFTVPYNYTWSSVPAGTYNITAKATDNSGGVTTSGIVSVVVQTAPPANVAPSVTLTSPSNTASYGEPGTILLSADASDTDGSIAQVQFYNGSTLLNTDASSPYEYIWSGVAAGNYNITAKATDNLGATKVSSVANITVVANVAPSVSIITPLDSIAYTTPADIAIEVEATDIDGNIVVVNFYEGTTWVGRDSSIPYTLTLTGYTTGVYSLRAAAQDNSGDSTSSSSKIVIVGPPPPLAITVTSSPILCPGGQTTITIGATGGVAPYTGNVGSYVVSAGTYTYIVIDDDGTQDTAIVTVGQPAPIVVTDSVGVISSYGGSTIVVAQVTGGTEPYQYKINNGFYQTSNTFTVYAGNYTLYIKDANGCTGSTSFSVTQPAGPGNSQRNKNKHWNF